MAISHAFLFWRKVGGTNSEGEELNPIFLDTQGNDGRGSSRAPDCEAADFGAAFDSYSLSNIFERIAEANSGEFTAFCRDATGPPRDQCVERPHCESGLA